MNTFNFKPGDKVIIIGNTDTISDIHLIRHHFSIGETVIVISEKRAYEGGRTGVYCKSEKEEHYQTVSPQHIQPVPLQTKGFTIKELMSNG